MVNAISGGLIRRILSAKDPFHIIKLVVLFFESDLV